MIKTSITIDAKTAEDTERAARKVLELPRKGVPYFGLTATGPRAAALLERIEADRQKFGDDEAAKMHAGVVPVAYAGSVPEDAEEIKAKCQPVADLAAAFPVTEALETKARADVAKAEATPDADAVVAVIDAAKPVEPIKDGTEVRW